MVDRLRRRLLAGSGVLAAAGLSGCAAPSGGGRAPASATSGDLKLLFYADTQAQWLPVRAHPAATHLGPLNLLGQAPYFTEQARLDKLGVAADSRQARWLTTSAARRQPQWMGGYAQLAQALYQERSQWGAQACLTLEGGQCWSGSGLAQMTQGRYGPVSSHWLGADMRLASRERNLWPAQVDALYREFGRPVLTSEQPVQRLIRADVRIAVIGVPEVWAQRRATDEAWNPGQWLESLQRQINQERTRNDLLLLVSANGTNPDLWLARQLRGVDLILSSGGQDLWPRLVTDAPVPVCLSGSQGQGYFSLVAHKTGQGWQFEGAFNPVYSEQTEPLAPVAEQLTRLRAPFASWLDLPLAEAPAWLYRRDVLAGSWDEVMSQALRATGASLTLMPGLRQGVALAPGDVITREHLLSLTAGHEAPVFDLPVTRESLKSRLEVGADQLLSEDWFLHTSEDMPRLGGAHYVLRYQAIAGQRVGELSWPGEQSSSPQRLMGWSPYYQGEGRPLWQLLEAWLREQPTHWRIPQVERPSLAFVDGHPGWHPAALELGA